MAFKRKSKVSAEIPSSAMSDIAFLLLVFFMTTTIFNVEKGIPVQLPQPGPPTEIKQNVVVTVKVAQDGSIYLDSVDNPKAIPSLSLLQDELERRDIRLGGPGKLNVIFEVDPGADFEMMIDVFDEIRKANIQKLALVIE
ncbi:biopolymer transporter ExbD [bacterium]|nr:biopolymer transporter ExbD [bacterium]